MSDSMKMNKEKLQSIITTGDQMPIDLEKDYKTKDGGLVQDLKEKHSLDKTKEEIALIDLILTGEYEESYIGAEGEEQKQHSELKEALTEDVLNQLRHKKMLDQAHLLINEHSYKDSPEMKTVKADALNLAMVLEENLNKAATPEIMEKVETAYSMACASCRYYLENKNPSFKKGKVRKEMVRQFFVSLSMDAMIFSIKRKEIGTDATGTLAELLKLKGSEVTRERPREVLNEKQEKKQAERQADPGVEKVAGIFSKDFDITGDILAGKNKAKKASGYLELRKIIKGFAPNQVEVADVTIMDKKVRLLQHSDNTVWIVDRGQEIPLDLNMALLNNKIEMAMMDNAAAFGDQALNDLMDGYEAEAFSAGEHTRVRTILARFLAQKTGLVENDFVNTFKEGLVKYAKDLIAGSITAEEIKKEVIESSKNGIFVNGVALSEMVRINKQMDIDQLRQMVVLEQKNMEEVVREGWTKEEQDVKNMLADLVFTNETEEMDISVQNPEIFMEHMLTKHTGALLSMLSGKVNVSEVLDKMSLGDLEGETEGKKVRLSDVVGRAVSSLSDFLKGQLKRFEKGGDLAGTKDVETDKKKLEYIISKGDRTVKAALSDVKKEMDNVVDESCNILQLNVSKMTDSLFPEKKEGEKDDKKTLQQMIDEASQSTKGMGLFMRTTLKNYFNGVSNMDKRAMIASVFRSAEKVPEFVGTDTQLADEMQELKLKKYEGLFKNKDAYGRLTLTEEDKKAIAQYRQEKMDLGKQANFFAGLLRGAGPLLQKMMQAMDRAPLPAQILKAIEDMKSNLPPIPDGVVQAEFLSMVQSSGGQVTKIERLRSLGAASVGQTFLCKVYGPKMPEGREVVIKLLRPDAKNRMQREESIMLQCAEKTDHSMFLTYQGQLEGFKKELDLSIEGQNCKEGVKYYEGRKTDVETMKVFDGIPATNTSLVVEKAEGVNTASYIKELEEFTDKELDELYTRYEEKGVTIVHKSIQGTPDQWDKMQEAKNHILDKIDEAVKRRDHLINLCNVWIDQAVMKDGFYHGDLHAGNIMITDEKATFIDYGNTTQLTEQQKLYISRMVVATQGSIDGELTNTSVDLFFESFNDLLTDNHDEEFLAVYTEEKKTQLKQVFSEVLKKGTKEEAGKRIYVALLKAQELGIKMPAAIQGFIEGQVRLQNTINRMNDAIGSMKNGVSKIDNAGQNGNNFDAVQIVLSNASKHGRESNKTDELFKRNSQSLQATDKESFKKALFDKTYVEEDEETGAPEINKRKEFKNKYYKNLSKLKYLKDEDKKFLGIIPYTEEEIKNGAMTIRQKARKFFDDNKDVPDEVKKSKEWQNEATGFSSELVPQVITEDDALEAYGGYTHFTMGLFTAFSEYDWNKVEDILKMVENDVPVGIEFVEKMDQFFENEDEGLADEVYESYTKVQKQTSKNHMVMSTLKLNLINTDYWDNMEKNLSGMFAEEQDGLGAKLREKFDAYIACRNKTATTTDAFGRKVWSPSEETADEYNKALDEFADVYQDIATIQLERFEKAIYQRKPNVKFVNFDNVMMDVVRQNVVSEDNSWLGNLKTMKNALALMAKLGDKSTTILKKLYM